MFEKAVLNLMYFEVYGTLCDEDKEEVAKI